MLLKEILYANDNIVKGIITSDSGKEYVSSYDGDNDATWCTCPYYIFKKIPCKHILFLLDNIDYENMKSKKQYKNFLCGCTTIDMLMGNGFPLGSVTALFGESGQGKTLLSAQLALSCIKNLNKDVIVVETEGNREQDYLELLLKFKDRFELTEEEIIDRIHFFSIIENFQQQSKAMVDLLKMVGYETEIDKSKKGDKYTITFKDCKPKLKDNILKSSGLLLIDSLTKPLKASIGNKTQNLPARAELSARFFARLYSISANYGLATVVIHHASINKTTFYTDHGNPYGGDEIFYNSKYIIQILKSDMASRAKFAECECQGKSAKRVMLVKHPYIQVNKEMFPIHLKKDFGFTDEI